MAANNKIDELYHQISAKIADYNSKIGRGIRLNEDESQDLSYSIKLYPLLTDYHKIKDDIDFAIANTDLFDESFVSNLQTQYQTLSQEIEALIKSFSTEDIRDFIIEMRAGAGGEEAALFCRDLFHAYTKHLTDQNIAVEVLDLSESDSGGYSTVIAEVNSSTAYNLLKNEGGVHRVQRVPKTESSGRIHTSTISIALIPIRQKNTVDIVPTDLRIDVYRSSGHGGQSVNTTDSAVRITHIPTGLVVTCQNTKSQIKNKEMALKVLKARLEEIENQKNNQGEKEIRNKQIQNSERAEKIRTYNYLQDRITDHRAKLDFSGINRFMQGQIQEPLEKINNTLDTIDSLE